MSRENTSTGFWNVLLLISNHQVPLPEWYHFFMALQDFASNGHAQYKRFDINYFKLNLC